MKKVWIATYVDYGETCDGKARVLDVFKTKKEAATAVRADIEKWRTKNQDEGVEVDFDKMAGWFDYNPDDRCEWNIEEAKLED